MTSITITPDAARAHAEATVKRSGTSFAAGMSILSKPCRDAMHAIYAFCREVDDIADDESPVVEKRISLAAWRAEIDNLYRGAPTMPTGIALLEPVRAFDLPKDEFFLVIEGMEMDAEGPIVAPSMDELSRYTRRVAGAVGMLSMPVFGAPRNDAAEKFALSLGDALQLTNILRDIAEDAKIGRLYLPSELLAKHGAPMTANAIVNASTLPDVALDLGALAKQKFADARAALQHLDWRILKPALLMMGVYETYLRRIEEGGWITAPKPVSISKLEKSLIAARWFFAPKLRA